MGWWVYILYSSKFGRYYIGQSADAERRLRYHNTEKKGFTSRYRPWELVYGKEYASRREAREVEQKIKQWKSAKRIRELIDGKVTV